MIIIFNENKNEVIIQGYILIPESNQKKKKRILTVHWLMDHIRNIIICILN